MPKNNKLIVGKLVLSVIIPCYNEEKTIEKILHKIIKTTKIKKQIILVDDGSTDSTPSILNKRLKKYIDVMIFHKKNKGKGAAIRSAKKFVNGDCVIIQDADLEYNPQDYFKMMFFMKKGYKVVYGSRVLGGNRYLSKNFPSFMRIFYNHVLTILSNLLNNQSLTDAHTCYKMFEASVFSKISLKENDFSFCPEITTKVGLKKIEIKEVSIRYSGRSYDDGKKIRFMDGVKAIKTLFKYRFFD